METQARLRIISQILRAGKRKIEHAEEHCYKGGIPTSIGLVLANIERVEQELKEYGRNQD